MCCKKKVLISLHFISNNCKAYQSLLTRNFDARHNNSIVRAACYDYFNFVSILRTFLLKGGRGFFHVIFQIKPFDLLSKTAVSRYYLGSFAKLRKGTRRFVMCVCRSAVRPHGTTRLLFDEFPLNSIFEYFSKTCAENLNFIKILQEKQVIYMMTYVP